MQFFIILVAILLGGCALIFVLYPIYERTRQSGDERNDYGVQDGSHEGQGDRTQSGGKPTRDIVGAGLAPALDKITALNGSLEHTQEEREQTARTALQEIELDFQLGNLAESDYRSWRERYVRRALLAMKSRHDREQELDEAIEEQLRRLRETDELAKEQ